MNDPFSAFNAVWSSPQGEWPVWIAARSAADAGVCAMVTFHLLEERLRRTTDLGEAAA